MKMVGTAIAAACVLFGLVLTAAHAAPARSGRINVAYVPPKNPVHQPIYERLGYKIDINASTEPVSVKDFADEHGTPAQRFYNLLCIAYGADAKLFSDIVEQGYLPKDRADGCEDEYQQVTKAFERLIAPHMDRDLAKKAWDKSWLPDSSAPIPRKPGAKQSGQPK